MHVKLIYYDSKYVKQVMIEMLNYYEDVKVAKQVHLIILMY